MYSLKITHVTCPLESVYLEECTPHSLTTSVLCPAVPSPPSLIHAAVYGDAAVVNSLLS